MEWLGWLIALLIAIGIIGGIAEAAKSWRDKRALEREVRERGLERLVFDEDESADPGERLAMLRGQLYWHDDCLEAAEALLKWRDRSQASILRLKLDALEKKNGVYLFRHRWGKGPFSTLSEVHAEDESRRG